MVDPLSTSTTPVRLQSLQALRAVAALTIVLYHLESGLNIYMPVETPISLFRWGDMGVPLFFVLSGFVVAFAGMHHPRPALEFLYGRLSRLYPTYLFTATLFISAIAILPASGFRGNPLPITLAGIQKTLFFEYGQISGYVYVGWVLYYEAWFYIAFALVIARFSIVSRQPWFSALISVGLIATAITQSNLISYFLIGIAAFLLAVNPGQVPLRSPWKAALLVAVVANFLSTPIALLAFALVVFLYLLETSNYLSSKSFSKHIVAAFRFLQLLGNSSYSIYLVQVLTLSASLKVSGGLVRALLPDLGSSYQYTAYWFTSISLGLTSTILAGILMSQYIEKPSYQALMRLLPIRAAKY